MALIRCPDCQKEVSGAAPACPGCGRPMGAAPMARGPACPRCGSHQVGKVRGVQGAGLVALYLASRRTALVFASGGGSRIEISAGHMERAAIVDVLDTVEAAKEQRASALASGRQREATAARNGGASAPARPAPAAPVATSAAIGRGLAYYFYTDLDGHVSGPVTTGELGRLAGAGAIGSGAQVCAEGTEHWQPLETVTTL